MAFLDGMDPAAARQLLDDLNYLNLAELRAVCRRYGIPWAIHVRTPDGGLRRTKHDDRKAFVLERLRRYLRTGVVPEPTVLPAEVVSDEPFPARPGSGDRLFFGRYDKHHPGLMATLRELTGGRFRDGAVARLVCRDFWVRGEAPTLAAVAAAWVEADARGLGVARGEHPEAAYLTDRAAGAAGPDWKAKREAIAARALAVLSTPR